MSDKDNPDFLDGFADSEAQPEPKETPEPPEPETPEVPAESEKGDKPEVPEATPATEPDKSGSVPIAALMAERDKRQKEQQQREALEKRLAELEQKSKGEAPDFYSDPQRYVQEEVSKAQQDLNAKYYAAIEAQARTVHTDYDEVVEEVRAYAQDNPAVAHQIMADPNPALAAYQYGKKLRALKEIDDPEAYKAKIIAEERAKWEAEVQAKDAAKRKAADAIPPDLSTARSPSNGGTPTGDPFDELFPRN